MGWQSSFVTVECNCVYLCVLITPFQSQRSVFHWFIGINPSWWKSLDTDSLSPLRARGQKIFFPQSSLSVGNRQLKYLEAWISCPSFSTVPGPQVSSMPPRARRSWRFFPDPSVFGCPLFLAHEFKHFWIYFFPSFLAIHVPLFISFVIPIN